MASVSRATSARTLLSMPSVCVWVCVCVWLLSVTVSFQSSVWRLRALRSVKTEDQRETLPPSSGGGDEGGGGGWTLSSDGHLLQRTAENILAKIQQWQSDSDSLSLSCFYLPLHLFILLSAAEKAESLLLSQYCCFSMPPFVIVYFMSCFSGSRLSLNWRCCVSWLSVYQPHFRSHPF